MAKYKDRNDETLENSIPIKPAKSLNKKIAKAKSENITSNQEQEIMEVHKHPHHVTDKKKWTEYLLEFLMIFFAVTMGFIAENMREETVEKHREKQFMISLVRDLELDTIEYSEGNKFRTQKIKAMDSVQTMLAHQSTDSAPFAAYFLYWEFWGCRSFYQNSGTLDQLKNSGGLRLISHRKVVDAIEEYDNRIKRMKTRDDVEINLFQNNDRLMQKLFKARYVIEKFGFVEYEKKMLNDSIKVKIDVSVLDEYLNNLQGYALVVKANQYYFGTCKQNATELINLIKKEYKLE